MEVVIFSEYGIIKKKKKGKINQSLILFQILSSLHAPLLVTISLLFNFDLEMYPAMPMERRDHLKIQLKPPKRACCYKQNQLHFSELFPIS